MKDVTAKKSTGAVSGLSRAAYYKTAEVAVKRDAELIDALNVIDEANREALLIAVGVSIPSAWLMRALERLIE